MNNRIFVLIFTIAVFIVGGILYIYNPDQVEYKNPNEKEPAGGEPVEPVACTMEAKLCPNGSYVGRSGPNCEFSPCPLDTSPSAINASSSQIQ